MVYLDLTPAFSVLQSMVRAPIWFQVFRIVQNKKNAASFKATLSPWVCSTSYF